jgi:hypothetical protein
VRDRATVRLIDDLVAVVVHAVATELAREHAARRIEVIAVCSTTAVVVGFAVMIEVANAVYTGFQLLVAPIDRTRVFIVTRCRWSLDAATCRVAGLYPVAHEAIAALRTVEPVAAVASRQALVDGASDTIVAIRI